MSPVGGVGINYAIQDAVVAANVLTTPLLSGRIPEADLAEVQRQREWPTRAHPGHASHSCSSGWSPMHSVRNGP